MNNKAVKIFLSVILAVVLIFGGVYLVTRSRSRADVEAAAAASAQKQAAAERGRDEA